MFLRLTNKCVTLLIIVLICLCIISCYASAEIHQGYIVFDGINYGFDFSAGTYSQFSWDLNYAITRGLDSNSLQFIRLYGSCQNCIMYSDSTYEELTTAPADSTLYTGALWSLTGKTYILRTQERHYVKFRTISGGYPVYIEYTYQDNGSQTVPIKITTWGKIKLLYR